MSKENNNDMTEEMSDAVDDVKEYINLRIQLIQLNITEKISIALANFISTGAAVIFFVLFFVFGSFALSYWLGNVFGSNAAGFGALAGFYLLVALILLLLRKTTVRTRLINLFIREFSNDTDA